MRDIFAVVEVYSGRYCQGFKTEKEAEEFVHKQFNEISSDEEYAFRLVKVISEWSSEKALPGERNKQ